MSRKKKIDLRLLKLRSGEEILTQIVGKKRGKIVVSRPLKINSSIVADPFSGVKRNMIFMNDWLGSSNEIQADIPTDFIVLNLTPDPDMIKLYEKQLMLDDVEQVSPPTPMSKKNPLPLPFTEVENFPKINDEEVKKMADEIAAKFENMIKDIKPNKDGVQLPKTPFEDFANFFRPPATPSIQFMFSIPHEIMGEWIECGFVEYLNACVHDFMSTDFLDEFMEEEKQFKKTRKKQPKKSISKKAWKEPSEEDKTKDGFGNNLKDWSPNIKDYIDDISKDEPPIFPD